MWTVEDAVTTALDLFIDTVMAGGDLHYAYNEIAVNVLDLVSDTHVHELETTSAVLDDGTLIGLRPNWAPTGALLIVKSIVGWKVQVKHLPVNIGSIRTVGGTTLHTWPSQGFTLLRGFNNDKPVLIREDGTRLYSPHDAATSQGTLLVTPTFRLEFSDGVLGFEDRP